MNKESKTKYTVRLTDRHGNKATIKTGNSHQSYLIAEWLVTIGGCHRADTQEQHGKGRPFIRARFRAC